MCNLVFRLQSYKKSIQQLLIFVNNYWIMLANIRFYNAPLVFMCIWLGALM